MKKSNNKKEEQLGMPVGTASNRLRKNIMFNLVKQLKLNVCHQCNKIIENVDEFSIEHKIPYLDSDNPIELFFDLNNIGFSHLKCNVGMSRSSNQRNVELKEGFRGVIFPNEKSRHSKFRVFINENKKRKLIGSFDSAIEAAEFYDKRSIEMFGEKAITNKKLGLLK